MTDATLWTAWHAIDIERRRIRRQTTDPDHEYELELTNALREVAIALGVSPEPEKGA